MSRKGPTEGAPDFHQVAISSGPSFLPFSARRSNAASCSCLVVRSYVPGDFQDMATFTELTVQCAAFPRIDLLYIWFRNVLDNGNRPRFQHLPATRSSIQ